MVPVARKSLCTSRLGRIWSWSQCCIHHAQKESCRRRKAFGSLCRIKHDRIRVVWIDVV